MTYYIARTVAKPFEQTIAAVTDALHKQGFGVLTDIDIRETLKKKLGVDIRPYRILSACSPRFAHQALQIEDKIGTMLPCNVIVQQRDDGRVEIAAVDPVASMQAVGNPNLTAVAQHVRTLLERAVESV